jgi:hypothetical protein
MVLLLIVMYYKLKVLHPSFSVKGHSAPTSVERFERLVCACVRSAS